MKKKKVNNKPIGPAPGIHVRINVMTDGSINVNGFPKDHEMTSEIFEKAQRVVNKYFIELAKQGKLDDFNRVKTSNILMPNKRIVPVGRG